MFMCKIILTITLTLAAVLMMEGNITVLEAADFRIAVLTSYKGPSTEATMGSFQQYLRMQSLLVNYDLFASDSASANVSQDIQKMRNRKPNLIFTLGSLATEATLKEIMDIPIVAGMILRADPFRKTSNGTGVILEFPFETQFNWLQRFLPRARAIGVTYDPKENQERIESASQIATRMGLRLEAQKVNAPQDLPEALKNLAKNADVFWGLPDNLVLNPQTAKQILLFSFQNRIPFIGLSPSWVKAGALYSLDWDYSDIGVQCGEMALKILQGASINSIPIAAPRNVTYALNLNTATQMKLNIPEELIRGAHQTF
jgi:putative ABC transport system substrate-binding protein